MPVRLCNGNTVTRLVGSQGSTETYPSTTLTCITRLGYFPVGPILGPESGPILRGYSDLPLVGGSRLSLLTNIILSHFY